MSCATRFHLRAAGSAVLLPLFVAAAVLGQAKKPDVFKLGSSGSLTKDMPKAKMEAANDSLRKLIGEDTGFKNELVVAGSLEKLEEAIKSGTYQLGFFQGYEFAWAQKRNAKLRPLAIAVNQERTIQAHVMVRKDSKATDLLGLKGQILAMPKVNLEHAALFVERQCQAQGKKPEEFFSKVTTPETVEDALDDVVDNVAQGTIIDHAALETYKARKPGRFAKLKEAQKTEVFPTGVVAYQEGDLDADTLKRFRTALLSAHKKDKGRKILELWKLTSFDVVPDDYDKQLANILKAYPPAK